MVRPMPQITKEMSKAPISGVTNRSNTNASKETAATINPNTVVIGGGILTGVAVALFPGVLIAST